MTDDLGLPPRDEPGGAEPAESAVIALQPPVRHRGGLHSLRRSADLTPEQQAAADWRWVEEWRQGAEPTPWGPGLALAGFAALIIGSAVYVISFGLSDRPFLAVLANLVVAAGLSPALWMSRGMPVLRWISLGGAIGTVIAWISVLFFPNF